VNKKWEKHLGIIGYYHTMASFSAKWKNYNFWCPNAMWERGALDLKYPNPIKSNFFNIKIQLHIQFRNVG